MQIKQTGPTRPIGRVHVATVMSLWLQWRLMSFLCEMVLVFAWREAFGSPVILFSGMGIARNGRIRITTRHQRVTRNWSSGLGGGLGSGGFGTLICG